MKKNKIKYAIGLLILCASNMAFSQKAYYSKEYKHYEDSTLNYGEIDHTVYLIGDAGEPNQKDLTAVDLLENHLKNETKKSTVIFFRR